MVRNVLFLALLVLLAVVAAGAQETDSAGPPRPEGSPGASSSARYYPRERKTERSKPPLRYSRAEIEAIQRTRRLESMRWYGLSNSRPVVSPTPMFGTYSPMWTSGGYDPSRWQDGPANSDYYLRNVRPRIISSY